MTIFHHSVFILIYTISIICGFWLVGKPDYSNSIFIEYIIACILLLFLPVAFYIHEFLHALIIWKIPGISRWRKSCTKWVYGVKHPPDAVFPLRDMSVIHYRICAIFPLSVSVIAISCMMFSDSIICLPLILIFWGVGVSAAGDLFGFFKVSGYNRVLVIDNGCKAPELVNYP